MTLCRIITVAAVLMAQACGPASRTTVREPGSRKAGLPPLADAPYELASNRDLEDVLDRYQAMAMTDAERPSVRRELADEHARRIEQALAQPENQAEANQHLLTLMSLWTTEELAQKSPEELTAELGPYAGLARSIRDMFARSGRDIEAVTALLVLALAEPGRRAEHLAEIDEIFAYADDLARAHFGDGAQSARPIEILEAIVEIAPMPEAVDRLISLYVTRQKAFHERFRKDGPQAELIRAHGESVFKSAWHVVRVLALAGRIEQAAAIIGAMEGLGSNKTLLESLRDALSAKANPRAWLDLAAIYSDVKANDESDETTSKLRAVLAICREGSKRFDKNAELPMCVADTARRLDKLHVAIRFYEQALGCDPSRRDVAEPLAELYRIRVSTLAFYERPLMAKQRLAELEAFHAQAAKRWPDKPLESDLADAYAAMGRGMTSLGELEEATFYLEKSLALRPTMKALEQLGTIALKQDRFGDAIKYFERGLAIKAQAPIDELDRARILRLAGDAQSGAGNKARAMELWGKSIDAWMAIGSSLDLPDSYKGELLVESGKAQWSLGDPATAMVAFDTAVDVDSDGADTHSSVVSFLIVRGEYERALDTFHRALGNHAIDDYSKVYLCLWMVTEARRSAREPDPLAVEYLASRKGRLWHHVLARYATGQIDFATLERQAKTRGQRAEILYYSAVLGNAGQASVRAALENVIATDMVLFYEYDMAKHWLSQGFAPPSRASR